MAGCTSGWPPSGRIPIRTRNRRTRPPRLVDPPPAGDAGRRGALVRTAEPRRLPRPGGRRARRSGRGGRRRAAADLRRAARALPAAGRGAGRAAPTAGRWPCWRRTPTCCWRPTSGCRGPGCRWWRSTPGCRPARWPTSWSTPGPAVLVHDPVFDELVDAALARLADPPTLIRAGERVRGAAGRGDPAAVHPGRRAGAAVDQLHVRHHRPAQGRDVPPSRGVPAGPGHGRAHRAVAVGGAPVDAADVPLQRLVLPVGGDRGRRHPRLPAQGGAGARSGG